MKNRIPRWTLGMVVLLCPALAFADDPAAAEALFKDALSKYKERNYAGACPRFAESQQLDPRPGTLFAMAECEAAADHIATAATFYEDFLRTVAAIENKVQQSKYVERAKQAQNKRDQLLPEIPRLTLVLPPGTSPDVRITRNGETFTATSLGVELPVNPGEHLITVQIASGRISEQRITIAHKEKQTLVLKVPEMPPAPMAPFPAEHSRTDVKSAPSIVPYQRLRMAGLVVGGVGIAGITTGIIAGAIVLGQKPVIEANCPNDTCNAEGMAAVNRLPALDVANAAGLALGGVATIAGAIMIGMGSRVPKEKHGNTSVQWQAVVGGSKDVMVGVKGAF